MLKSYSIISNIYGYLGSAPNVWGKTDKSVIQNLRLLVSIHSCWQVGKLIDVISSWYHVQLMVSRNSSSWLTHAGKEGKILQGHKSPCTIATGDHKSNEGYWSMPQGVRLSRVSFPKSPARQETFANLVLPS